MLLFIIFFNNLVIRPLCWTEFHLNLASVAIDHNLREEKREGEIARTRGRSAENCGRTFCCCPHSSPHLQMCACYGGDRVPILHGNFDYLGGMKNDTIQIFLTSADIFLGIVGPIPCDKRLGAATTWN